MCEPREIPKDSELMIFPRRLCCLLMVFVIIPSFLHSEVSIQIRPKKTSSDGTLLQWTDPNPDQSYIVQSRDDLGEGIWLTAPHSAPWPSVTKEFLDTRPSVAQRFFRVVSAQRAERGRIISTTTSATYDSNQLNNIFQQVGISINAQHGVVIHKIVYETIGPWGGKVQASGMLALPQTEGPAWPLVSYQHGTLTQRSDAPSAASDLEGLVFAGTGYVTVLPDYLGLGDSSGVQFYLHARTTATTGVDLIRAVRTFCTNQSISLNGQVFLCGFSQGGHATLAMLREIEKFHANEFTISAAAPIAGAYDLSEVTTADFLSGRSNSPVLLSLLLASYQEIYHLAPSWADILQAPYDVNIPPLLNGEHSFEEIAELLPNRPSDVLRPQYLAAFRDNPKHPLRLALRESDVIGWKPLAPVRLYHCHADEVVLYANSTSARESFQRQGATQVQVVDPAPSIDYSHGSGFLPCMELTKAWFDSLKR